MNEWHYASVTVDFKYQSSNIVIASTKLSNDGLIDLDDVKLTPSSCQQPATCNFNNDWCGFTYNYNVDYKTYWQLGVGRVMDPKQLKSAKTLISDADPNNYYGGLIYTDVTTNINRSHNQLDLFSDVIHSGTSSIGSCLQFSFMPRSNSINFAIYVTLVKKSQRVQTVWRSSDEKNPIDKWTIIKKDVNYKESSFRFLFTIESDDSSTYMLVDDVKYFDVPCNQVVVTTQKPTTTTTPKPTASPSHAFDCDFENGWCNWKTNKKNFVTFFQMKTSKSNDIYIPNFDHTKDNVDGRFVYQYRVSGPYMASIYATDNSENQIRKYRGPVCLKFWYFMLTESWETYFNVKIYQNNNTIKSFYQTDDKGKKWNLGMIQYEIDKQNEASEFQVSIFAQFRLGTIAFDDFKVSYSYCGTGQHSGECYFEGGDCGLKPSNPLPQPNWKITKGSTLNIADHTINTVDGSFFAVDFSQQQQNRRDQVELSFYNLKKTKGTCIQFWYFMNGFNANQTLNFVVYQNNQPKTVWHATGNQGAFWHVHRETIVLPNLSWKFSFIADGLSTKGIIAVDDVTIDSSGPCKWTSGN